MQILRAEQRLARELRDICDDIEELTKVNGQLFVYDILDCTLLLSRIRSLTINVDEIDELVEVQGYVNHYPEGQVDSLLLKRSYSNYGFQHRQQISFWVFDDQDRMVVD